MTVPAGAQFILFRDDYDVRNKPVIADITVTLTAETPWGPYTQTQSGKYWRSRDGKTRRDDAFGNSHIEDLHRRVGLDPEVE